MKTITTHLWFDNQAKEAANFYLSAFEGSKIKNSTVIHGTPSGSCDLVIMDVMGHEFQLISAGSFFQINPSISSMITLPTTDAVNSLWERLSVGGMALMPLDSYPFSDRYGWLQDQYGVSWQIMVSPNGQSSLTPVIMFIGDNCGKAEEAMKFYTSVFDNAKIEEISRYDDGEGAGDAAGTVKDGRFTLEGQGFAAMDSAHPHQFALNEAVSFLVECENQDEIDHLWEKLSAHPESEQCGWLKDIYGLSWQIGSAAMGEMLSGDNEAAVARLTQAFLQMKKFDLAKLEAAYKGE